MSGRASRRAVSAGAVAAGAALGWVAERRALAGLRDGSDPETAALATPLPASRTAVVAADGTSLAVESLGPASAPTVVLVHGYALTQGSWHYQRRDLSDEFHVVSYDQRGHGTSGEPPGGDYRVEALADDLATVLEHAVPDGQRAVLAGHSLGAMTILALARHRPAVLAERVAGAVLVDTTAADVYAGALGTTPLRHAAALLRLLAAAGGSLLPRLVGVPGRLGATPSDFTFLLIRAVALSPDATPAHVALTERLNLACPSPVRAALIPLFTALELDDAAGALRVPALVVVGERDRLTPPHAARRLHERLADSRLVVLPGVGHMSQLEAHETVTAHVRAFARGRLQEAA